MYDIFKEFSGINSCTKMIEIYYRGTVSIISMKGEQQVFFDTDDYLRIDYMSSSAMHVLG